MRNEITDLILEELEKYGLEGVIADRSKHLEISWSLPQGGSRFIIVPRTPSDWRSGMNSRSDLRKMLRQDNVPLKQETPTSFNRAMSLPKESIVSQAARERALCKDVETLSELVLELQEQNTQLLSQMTSMLEKMTSISVVSTVMSSVSFAGSPQVVAEQTAQAAAEARPLPRSEHVTSNEVVLANVQFNWTPKAEIIRKSAGLSIAVIGQCLHRLRKRGLVENGSRGQWRKKKIDGNVVLFGSGNQSGA